MNYKEAKALASEYDKGLLATDPRFRRSVLILHEDGSILRFANAFLMRKGMWVFVFTEHFGTMVFDKDDLISYREYVTMYDIEEMK